MNEPERDRFSCQRATPPVEASTDHARQTSPTNDSPPTPAPGASISSGRHREWLGLFVQPALFLACGAILLATLGLAQRFGFITAGGGQAGLQATAGGEDVLYICPMMCTPPQSAPGRCPVCGMELVPSTTGGKESDSQSIRIDPATRRVANIHTVAVKAISMTRFIRAVGELSYDEGKLKTISAYVDGRLERLYADYTGVEVQKGDHLALLYSPLLYSAQTELLLARKAKAVGRRTTLQGIAPSSLDLYENAKRRLIELGVTEEQIAQLEQMGEANSRVNLWAPIGGTVIEKLGVEGQYVKEGDAIYKLADLSTIWLMLRLFPEDAASVRYGQKVEAQVQSLPGRILTGRVAFVDPSVDPVTRTVGVRVVIENVDRRLRVGDYAKAVVEVPVANASDTGATPVYDPELANKWISPRHPHVIESSPGQCRECGVDLVPAAQFGFTDVPADSTEALAVPRNAVLLAGDNSVVYVETTPGRFEIRRVVLGPSRGDEIVIQSGVAPGEQVATRGNLLIDSQMQLAGNPSLIDPTMIESPSATSMNTSIAAALTGLSPDDRSLVESQEVCPVTEMQLGSMGPPPKVDVNGYAVFICCEGCRKSLLEEPEMYLARLADHRISRPAPSTEPQMDLPPIGELELLVSPESLPSDRASAPHAQRSAGEAE